MVFESSPPARALRQRLLEFFASHITPHAAARERELAQNRRDGRPFATLEVLQHLQAEARKASLWNLFLPASHGGLSNLLALTLA